MWQGYTLEWLDTLITVSLNPEKTDFNAIFRINTSEIKQKIVQEKIRIKSLLKEMVFSLGDEGKIKLFIRQYHSSLALLLNQAVENHSTCPIEIEALKELTRELMYCVEDLLSFIEGRFFDYLSTDDPISSILLSEIMKDLRRRLDKLQVDLKTNMENEAILEVLFHELYPFTAQLEKGQAVIFREVSYFKALCRELECLRAVEEKDDVFTSLDQLLIYMNFNSSLYIDNLIQRIIDRENGPQNNSEKVELLLFYYKLFNQIQMKPGMAFIYQDRDMKSVLNNWFHQEISYLKRSNKLSFYNAGESIKRVKEPANRKKDKILCQLSTDQIAIILRSADELNILMAKSMSMVFKSIVPFLSTPYKKDLSYDAVRSKSYAVETKDKTIAIRTLENMIDKIREY